MADVKCFLMLPSERVKVSLRRFTFGNAKPDRPDFPCPGRSNGDGHDSGFRVIIENDERPRWQDAAMDGTHRTRALVAPIDERWPLMCVWCHQEFPPEAERQVWSDLLYFGAPDARMYTRRDMPAGAMFDAPELHSVKPWCGPDGKALHVVLPDGTTWHIDGPGNDKGFWTRTGEPPKITASPSIRTANYHGVLVDGVLSDV